MAERIKIEADEASRLRAKGYLIEEETTFYLVLGKAADGWHTGQHGKRHGNWLLRLSVAGRDIEGFSDLREMVDAYRDLDGTIRSKVLVDRMQEIGIASVQKVIREAINLGVLEYKRP